MIFTRPAIAEDQPFIVSGWSASYRASKNETRPKTLYAKQKHEEVEFYLARCRTLVAHGETGVLFGFIAYDPTTYAVRIGGQQATLNGYVLYVYVDGEFRRRGVARALFTAAGISPTSRFGYACQTRWTWELRSKIPLAKHEPFRARYEEIEHGRATDRTEAAPGPNAHPGQEDLVPRG